MPALDSWVSYLISPVPNQHPLLFCLLSVYPTGAMWDARYTVFLLQERQPRLCRCWEVLVLRLYPTRRVGWPQFQEGRSRRQKSDLAWSGMQHPLGNAFSCSLTSTNETWVPKRTWAGIPRITLTLLIQISPGIWLELICISSQGLIRIRVIGMVAGEGEDRKPVFGGC